MPSPIADALARITALLPHASAADLREAAAGLHAAAQGGDPDIAALAEGLVALLDVYGPDADRELLAVQLEGELATIAQLVARAPRAPTPPPPPAAASVHALPAWVDRALLAEFVDGQRHSLAEIEAILLDPSAGEVQQARIARILHTLKGESGTVGLSIAEEVYHALEDRLGAASSLQDFADDAFTTKDWLLRVGAAAAAGEAIPDGQEELLATLRGPPPNTTPFAPAPPNTTNAIPRTPDTIALFNEFFDESAEALAQADELLVSFEQGRAEPDVVDALFRTFHTIKGLAGFLDLGGIQAMAHSVEALLDVERTTPGTLGAPHHDLLLRATNMVRSVLQTIRKAIESEGDAPEVAGFEALLTALIQARRPTAPAARSTSPSAPVPKVAPPAAEGGEEGGSPQMAVVRETIKLDLQRLDNLVETIGELVIVESMVANAPEMRSHLSQRTRHQLTQLSKIVRDLQRQGLSLRMVTLRGVFQKMSRLVRDLSRRSGKPVNLVLSGHDAEMDRSLAERLGDPLVHMMRNAVDHGIEPAEVRVAYGKPETATVRLSAYHEGGNIIIELADDGKGLDRGAIFDKAVRKGLISEDAVLADREIFELIFAPGFSTAAQVTELSGRGVGMDVVKKTVEDLRGRIQIWSEEGHGTKFRLVLPLTLAIIDGLLLVVGTRRYVIPTLAITESLQPDRNQIHRYAGGGRIIRVREDQLPIVDLGSLLGVPSRASEDPTLGFVVVVDDVHGRFGLLVDDLIGQQQVVIKQIDETVNQDGLFSGGAILSDGQVGMILNPTALRSEKHRERRVALEAG